MNTNRSDQSSDGSMADAALIISETLVGTAPGPLTETVVAGGMLVATATANVAFVTKQCDKAEEKEKEQQVEKTCPD